MSENWVQKIRDMKDGEIENMVGTELSPIYSAPDRRFDFAMFELQRRVQVKNVKAIRELRDDLSTMSNQLKGYRKDIKRESVVMRVFTIVLIIVAGLQLFVAYKQFELNKAQTELFQNQALQQNL